MATLARPEAGRQPPGPWMLPAPWWARYVAVLILVPVALGVALAAHKSPGQRSAKLAEGARTMLQHRDPVQAVVFAREAVALAPGSPDAMALLGSCLVAAGRDAEALEAFRRAVTLAPSHYAANCALAAWEIDQALFAAAETHATNALRSTAQTDEALSLRAAARVGLGNPALALEDYLAASRYPDAGSDVALRAAWTAEFLARTTWRDSYSSDARAAYAAAADTASTDGPGARALHARALVGLSLHDLAVRTVGPLPQDDEGALALASALAARGDAEGAEISLRRGFEARGGVALADQLVRLLVRTERLEAAAVALVSSRKQLGDESALAGAEGALRRAVVRSRCADTQLVDAMTPDGFTDDPFASALAAGLATDAPTIESRRARLGCYGPGLLAATLTGSVPEEEFLRAAEDVDALLAADRYDTFALVWHGAIHLARGNARDALTPLDAAIRAEPGLRQARHVRSLALASLGEWDDAAKDAAFAWATARHCAPLAATYVRALHRSGRAFEAVQAGRSALLEFPSDVPLTAAVRDAATELGAPDARSARERSVLDARIALARGDTLEAAVAAETLLRDAPDDVDGAALVRAAWDRVATAMETAADAASPAKSLRRAACLIRAGRPAAAALALRGLTGRDDAAPAGIDLARVFARQGDLESAEAILRGVVATDPSALDARFDLGRILRLRGLGDEATRTWLDALAQTGDVVVRAACAREALTSAAPGDGTADEVRRWLRATTALPPGVLEMTEGWCSLAEGDFTAAGKYADAARPLAPGDVEASVLAGTARLAAGDAAGAETEIVAVLAAAPGHPAARAVLAHARVRRGLAAAMSGDVPAAREHWTGALLGVPSDFVPAMLLAQSLAASSDESRVLAAVARIESRDPRSSAAPLVHAQWLRLRGRESEAFPRFREALAREPGNPVLLAGLVDTARGPSQLEAAASACHVEIERGDPVGFAAYHLGLVEEKNHDDECAEKAYRDALARHAANLPALGRLVPMLMRSNRAAEARELLARARQTPGASRRRNLRVAELLAGTGDVAGAADQLAGAADDAPQTRFALAQLLAAAGDLGGAERELESLLAKSPGEPAPYLQLLDVMLEQRRDADAETRFRRAVREHPANPAPHCALAMLAERRGDVESAEAHYRRAVLASPAFSIAANNLACLLAERVHRPAEALDFAAKAKTAAPSDPDVADTYGWVLHLNGESSRALPELDLACRLSGGNAAHEIHRAEVLLALGRKGDAADAYSAAMKRDPEFTRSAASSALARLGVAIPR